MEGSDTGSKCTSARDEWKSTGEDALCMFNGVEDIRLYEKEKKLHYIGTSMSHCECDGEYGTKNWIVSGVYNHVEKKWKCVAHCRAPTILGAKRTFINHALPIFRSVVHAAEEFKKWS